MEEKKPSRFLGKLAQRLFTDAGEQGAFIDALHAPREYPGAILWVRGRAAEAPFEVIDPVAWQWPEADRVPVNERPGKHPLHEAGRYYCLDLSSLFAAAVFRDLISPAGTILDLCAAPGGKSIAAWINLSPRQLICNETIGKRLGALISNLKRCEIAGSVAVTCDPRRLAEPLAAAMDLVIADVPCSGQSLLVKGRLSPGCFHPSTINLNSNRQKRIAASAVEMVRGGGYLAYMTCTFSPEENEAVGEWILKRFPHFEVVPVPALAGHESHLADFPCYRLWPQSGVGAGAFTMLLRNTESEGPARHEFELPIAWRCDGALRAPCRSSEF